MVSVSSIQPIPGGTGGVGQVLAVESLPGSSGGAGTSLATVTLRSVERVQQSGSVIGPDGEPSLPPPILAPSIITTVQAVPSVSSATTPIAADDRTLVDDDEDAATRSDDNETDESISASRPGARNTFADEVSLAEQQTIQLLRARDGAVRMEEAVHSLASGAYSGAISYRYLAGPDGRLYAVGGSVTASTAGATTPEAQAQALDAIADGGSVVGATSAADAVATSQANSRLNLLSAQASDAYLRSSRYLA